MVQVTLRRRLPYNTNSNLRKVVRTPGGKYVFQYRKKPGKAPKCGDCKTTLPGCAVARPAERKRLSKTKKHVKRSYGGNLCHQCVKQRITRCFLVEEQKIVAKVLKSQKKTDPKTTQTTKSKSRPAEQRKKQQEAKQISGSAKQ